MEHIIESALRHVLNAEIKQFDAPASADTHIDQAIVLLRRMCPEWTPQNTEQAERIQEAEEHMHIYKVPNTGGELSR